MIIVKLLFNNMETQEIPQDMLIEIANGTIILKKRDKWTYTKN